VYNTVLYHGSYMLDISMITILDYACVVIFCMFSSISLFIARLGRYWWSWVCCSGSDSGTPQDQEYFEHIADL